MSPWTVTDRRRFEHVRNADPDRGVSPGWGEDVAARTFDSDRRTAAETPNARPQWTGSPTLRLEDRSKDELYAIAKGLKIDGRSRMSREQLVEAIRTRR